MSLENFNMGDAINGSFLLISLQLAAVVVFLIVKQRMTGDRFKRFLAILAIGIASAVFPFGLFGVLCGTPAMILMAIMVSLFLDRPKNKGKSK